MSHRFLNKTAIITGASSGIGKATALAFAREGMRIVLASRHSESLASVENEARRCASAVVSLPTDVTAREQVSSLVAKTLERFGSVDIVVLSAGEYIRGHIENLKVEDFVRAMEVNFFGCLYMILSVLPIMVKQGSGHIVAVSSVDGKKGLPLDAPYVASKFALTGLMDVLRQELHGTGVHALTVLPGRVDTPMIEHLKVPIISKKISPERVARAILGGIRRRRPEILVPAMSSWSIVLANAVYPDLANWLVRLFRLEGIQTDNS